MSAAKISLDDGKLHVAGSIDFNTAVSLWKESLPLMISARELIFDFSGVTSANSAALSLLLEWEKYANKQQREISFQNIPAQLKSIAAVAGVEQLIPGG